MYTALTQFKAHNFYWLVCRVICAEVMGATWSGGFLVQACFMTFNFLVFCRKHFFQRSPRRRRKPIGLFSYTDKQKQYFQLFST